MSDDMTPKQRDAARYLTYRCAHCGGVYDVPLEADARAPAEALRDYGRDGHDPDMVVTCDDCYKLFKQWEQGLPRS